MHVAGRVRWGQSLAIRCAPLALAGCLAARAAAQAPPSPDLPESPVPAAQAEPGTVAGNVTDVDGGAVIGARVTLTETGGMKTLVTDARGGYTFSGVAAGPFSLTISADGFLSGTARGTVQGGQTTAVASLALSAASSTDVTVTSSMADVGKAEVKVEETQRLLGALPNYFVAYDWHAPPLTQHQKFELSYKSVFDPVTVLISEVTAGVQEATNELPGYGKGGNGFVKRAGANQANVVIGTFTGGYLFPLILHQDPRYFYMGPEHGTVTHRFLYAISTGFITRGDNGKWQPNYSSVLGDLATGAAANAYYPASNQHGWVTVIDAGLLGAALDGVGNLVQEFLYKKLTPHSPDFHDAPVPGLHP